MLNGENNDTRYTKDNRHSPFSSSYRSRLRQCEILEVIIMIILEFKFYDRLDFKKKMKVCRNMSTKFDNLSKHSNSLHTLVIIDITGYVKAHV